MTTGNTTADVAIIVGLISLIPWFHKNIKRELKIRELQRKHGIKRCFAKKWADDDQ